MKTYRIIGLLIFMLSVALVGTAIGQQEEHGTTVRVHDRDDGRGWLGVSISDVSRSEAKEEDLKAHEGALVRSVEENTPADSAGIKDGDIITEYNGKKIAEASDLMEAVRETKPGTVVQLTVMRNKEKTSLKATIGTRPHEREMSIFRMPRSPHPPQMIGGSSSYGLSLLELNQQLGDYFGAPGGKGVLVQRVRRDSEAEKAGFKAGDVIIRVGKETIADVGDIREALSDYKEGEKADVEVLRKGVHKTLTLAVKESGSESGYMFRFNGWPFEGDFQNFDVEIPDKEHIEKFRLEGDQLKHEMEKMRQELQKLPQKINEEMKDLREKIKEAVSKVRVTRSV